MSEENKDFPVTIDTLTTAINQEYINLRDAVLNSDENIPDSPFVQSYKRIWDRLSVSTENNNLVLLDSSRIIVPQKAIKDIVKLLHQGHPGITKAQKLGSQLYYWPGMNNDIAQVVNNCESCQQLRPTQPNMTSVPDLPSSHASFPMQAVGTDLFSFQGNDYLVLVDRCSGYYEKLKKTETSYITAMLTNWFNILGWPETIRSDNGPQYRTSSPNFAN